MSALRQLVTLCILGGVVARPSAAAEPKEFLFNPSGGDAAHGGTKNTTWTNFVDSPRFRFFYKSGAQRGAEARVKTGVKHLEAAYECFTGPMGWRSSGISYNGNQEQGPYYKLNAFAVTSPSDIGGAGGVMGSDRRTGHAFLYVVHNAADNPGTTVHEYGHCLTYYERNWVDQGNTGTWWEPVAEWFSDHYMTSATCAPARKKYGFNPHPTKLRWEPVINNAHLVLVDGTPSKGNYYQSWPFLAYLTYNPDKIKGLGNYAVRDMFRAFKKPSNQTPLHSLATIIAPTPVGEVVAKYWARVAVGEIGHPNSRSRFESARRGLNFASLDKSGSEYSVKGARAPKYMGAGVHPIKGSGKVTVRITAGMPFTAMISVRSRSGAVKLVALPKGSGEATIGAGDEAALVVVNTPANLVIYNGFQIAKSAAAKTLSYKVKISGASL